MKSLTLGLAFLIITSGCVLPQGRMYGRNHTMNAGYYGMRGSASSELRVGARGRVSPHGGSEYEGTGYLNPELPMMAAAWRASSMRASTAASTAPMTINRAEGDEPMTAVDPEARARLDALEELAVTDHLPE